MHSNLRHFQVPQGSTTAQLCPELEPKATAHLCLIVSTCTHYVILSILNMEKSTECGSLRVHLIVTACVLAVGLVVLLPWGGCWRHFYLCTGTVVGPRVQAFTEKFSVVPISSDSARQNKPEPSFSSSWRECE